MSKIALMVLALLSSLAAHAQLIAHPKCTVSGQACMQDTVLLGNAGVAIAAGATDEQARVARVALERDTLQTQWSWSSTHDRRSMLSDQDRAIWEMRAAIKKGRVLVPLAQIDMNRTNDADCATGDCTYFNPSQPAFMATKLRAAGELLSDSKRGLRICRSAGAMFCIYAQGVTMDDIKRVVERHTIPTVQVSDALVGAESLANPPFVALRGKIVRAGLVDGKRAAVASVDCIYWMSSSVLIGRPVNASSDGEQCVE